MPHALDRILDSSNPLMLGEPRDDRLGYGTSTFVQARSLALTTAKLKRTQLGRINYHFDNKE